jgi:hypothetical protein
MVALNSIEHQCADDSFSSLQYAASKGMTIHNKETVADVTVPVRLNNRARA